MTSSSPASSTAAAQPAADTPAPRPIGAAAGGAVALLVLAAALYREPDRVMTAAAVAVTAAAALAWIRWLTRRHRRAVAALQAAKDAAISEQDARWRSFHVERMEAVAAALRELAGPRMEAVAQGRPAPPPRTELEPQMAEHMEQVLQAAAKIAERCRVERDRVDSVIGAVVATGQDFMAAALRVQQEAAAMLQRHSADPDVLEVGNRVDHAAAQLQRRAQSLVVLAGQHPGQQWPDLPLVEVVRAAQGRIVAFDRVQVAGDGTLGVAAVAAEPLIHLVAELLANATQSSTPVDPVEVRVRPLRDGAVIEIDDCGLGMDPQTLARQREIASGRTPVGLADLGPTPQLGLAVVGEYARRYGFGVELRESMYRGIQAVVWVPAELTVIVDPIADPALEPPVPVAEAAAPPQAAQQSAVPPPAKPEELPQRRSRRGQAPARPAAAPDPADGVSRETPEEAAAWAKAYFGAADGSDRPDPADTSDTEERR
ncbi:MULTISPECIES: ATP-binding protein [Thermomonospora]|uniref:histidine kinase n=1 Tax=Thermomonospora curvata (strain ATCC 19995 / DSM 43183 / JCM 3096 / KCTC 9072 / NBRC 15933 / NCIMB 10081 / Henssen B9) TaxID=471852 RepID=D1AAK6_THECD|nr:MULTISPECIES: ATP-binding protein [Thermomonospora]ACY97016.1 ATP-binding region ATPase domain protein [Thermomonospora curvata DSM 43183]